jgi:hypothetical protein
MPIHITETPDVSISRSELLRLRQEYDRSFMMYAGPLPDFEEWAIAKIQRRRAQLDKEAGK